MRTPPLLFDRATNPDERFILSKCTCEGRKICWVLCEKAASRVVLPFSILVHRSYCLYTAPRNSKRKRKLCDSFENGSLFWFICNVFSPTVYQTEQRLSQRTHKYLYWHLADRLMQLKCGFRDALPSSPWRAWQSACRCARSRGLSDRCPLCC